MEQVMKDCMEMWEKNVNSWMDQMAKNENFVKNYMKTYEPVLSLNKNLRDQQEKFYEMVGIPSRNDIVRVMQKLHDVETMIADLNQKIDTLWKTPAAPVQTTETPEVEAVQETMIKTPETTARRSSKKN